MNENPPSKILTVDEFLKTRQEVVQQIKTLDQSAAIVGDDAAPPGEDTDIPPGEEPEQVTVPVSISINLF